MKKAIYISSAGLLLTSFLLTSCGGSSSMAQPLAITTASLPNGTAFVAYSQSIHSRGGVGPYNWSVKNGALPHNVRLSSSTAMVATLSGTPDTAVQGQAFTLQVTDSAGHSASQAFSVSILLEPDTLVASSPSLSFGAELNGTPSSAQTITLTNNGSSALVIVGVAMTGVDMADFASTNTCGASIAPGGNCNLSVTFTPSALGPRAAAITITDNSQGSPHSYSLDGMGVTQGPNVTFWTGTNYSFSTVPGVTSMPQQVRVANFGTANLTVNSVVVSLSFSETNNCVGTIPPGASCYVSVTFTSATSATIQGSLSLNDNAPASPQSASLTGTSAPGMCVKKNNLCSSSLPCCPGLKCTFLGGILRPRYECL